MDTSSAKQQIVEKIKDSNNILVTVSESPSVDELSAALGLTLMLNKMNKHATAVFSGTIPAAIKFLEPDKTFEDTVDSLRDFIIALNKEKADHLRYKVDGDVVKIFITPYRTTIDDSDLEFSQGDYNVELVLALGVKTQENLDKALEAHGRIFHDATVATLSAGSDESNLGSIDWNEHTASSLSEMLVGLSEALKSDKSLLDERVATALLTGVVATTDRFSNNLTSSKVMTVAAQLMSAGANQQLIAAKLEEAHEISDGGSGSTTNQNSDGSTDLSEDKPSKVKRDKDSQKDKRTTKQKEPEKKNNGELSISHEMDGDIDEVAKQTAAEDQEEAAKHAEAELERQTQSDSVSDNTDSPEQELAEHLADVTQTSSTTPSVADLQKDIASAASDVDAAATNVEKASEETAESNLAVSQQAEEPSEPTLGGTLNATTEEAAEEKRFEEKSDRNHTILSHRGSAYMDNGKPTYDTPLNSTVDAANHEEPSVDPMAEPTQATAQSPTVVPPTTGMTLAQIDSEHRSPHEQARDDIAAAYSTDQPPQLESSPEPAPSPLPPMPDFSTLPPLPPIPGQPSLTPDMQTPSQPAPSITSPPANPFVAPTSIEAQPAAPISQPISPSDPGQFKIPGS